MSAKHPSTPQSATGPGPALRGGQVQAVVKQLRIVYRAMQEYSRWVEKQCGVSAAQLWALWELANHPGRRVSELSQALTLHQSTTSNLLDKLEKKGLVERRRGGPDQRVVQVFLTAAGQEIVVRAPRPTQGEFSAALARLPENDLADLEQGLAALIANMDRPSEPDAADDGADDL